MNGTRSQDAASVGWVPKSDVAPGDWLSVARPTACWPEQVRSDFPSIAPSEGVPPHCQNCQNWVGCGDGQTAHRCSAAAVGWVSAVLTVHPLRFCNRCRSAARLAEAKPERVGPAFPSVAPSPSKRVPPTAKTVKGGKIGRPNRHRLHGRRTLRRGGFRQF